VFAERPDVTTIVASVTSVCSVSLSAAAAAATATATSAPSGAHEDSALDRRKRPRRGGSEPEAALSSASTRPPLIPPNVDLRELITSRARKGAPPAPPPRAEGPRIPPNVDLRELITSRRARDAAAADSATAVVTFRLDAERRPPVSVEVVTRVKSAMAQQRGYRCELEPGTLAEVRRLLRSFGLSEDALDRDRLDELRRCVLRERCRATQPRVLQLKSRLLEQYEAGTLSVVAIARANGDLPPVACARAILQEKGVAKQAIRKLLGGASPSSLVAAHPREVAEIELAKASDCASWASTDEATPSRAFERELERMLESRGVRFSSELVSTADEPLTPDILVHGELRFGEFAVRWIDAKNYWGGVSDVFDKSARLQALKYVARFGPGAVVYSGGVTSGGVHPAFGASVALLDVEWLRGAPAEAAPRSESGA